MMKLDSIGPNDFLGLQNINMVFYMKVFTKNSMKVDGF
jgi:hypothetical protein